MTTATNDTAKALPPKDFLVKDYEIKGRYLTDHFGRIVDAVQLFRRH